MGQSLVCCWTHLVWSTKDHYPFLNSSIRPQLYAYIGGTATNLGTFCEVIGGVSDHIHILCRLSKQEALADVVGKLKSSSSRWIKTQGPQFQKFHWQNGYGAFSISPGHVDKLRAYIENQEEHHRKETFQDEYRRFLRSYGIEFDERYLWD